jgi:invasion protein IalB
VLAFGTPASAQESAANVPATSAAAGSEIADPWAMACRALGPGETVCGLMQRQTLENGGVLLVLELAGLEAERTPVLVVTTPLGVRLRDGVSLEVGSDYQQTLAFEICRQGGCIARISGEDMLGQLRAGAAMEVRFTLEAGAPEAQPITLTAPLAGITRSVDLIRGAGR